MKEIEKQRGRREDERVRGIARKIVKMTKRKYQKKPVQQQQPATIVIAIAASEFQVQKHNMCAKLNERK